MKRILFVATQMEAGGVQVLAIGMLDALLAEGHQAELAFLYRKRPVFDGVPGVHALLPHPVRSPIDLIMIAWRLWRTIRTVRPDAIVGLAHYSSPLAAIFGWLGGVSRRIATQTSSPDSQNRLARGLDWLCGTLGLYTSNIAASRTLERSLAHYPESYRASLKTVYNGVRFTPSRLSKADARAAFGLDPAAFLMVNTGRLSLSKNQRFLVEVVARLPDVKLAILGEGEERSNLQRLIESRGVKDRVSLLGEVPPDRVADFLRCGDLFVFPSLHEAFGVALVEAMLAELPFIASTYPALAEVVGDAGILLPIADPQTWAETIVALRRGGDLETLGRQARARGEKFTFSVMLEAFKKEWE